MSLDAQQSLQPASNRFSPPYLLSAPLPPHHQAQLPGGQWPWLYSAILGNGRVLACLDDSGSLAQLFYPSLDAGPHVRNFFLGIQCASDAFPDFPSDAVLWLSGPDWSHSLRYFEDAPVLLSISTHATLPIRIEREIFVHHECDALLDQIRLVNTGSTPFSCQLVVFAGFDFDHRPGGQTCYFDAATSSLLFFANERYLSLSFDQPLAAFDCDKCSPTGQGGLFHHVSQKRFFLRDYALGRVEGSLCSAPLVLHPQESVPVQLKLGLGHSFANLTSLSEQLSQAGSQSAQTLRWWQDRYASALSASTSPTVRSLYLRSLITLNLLTDRQSGGIVAAPECDPDFLACGGYGFCWPRDGSFIAYALDSAGQHDHARLFYDWALRTQEPSGAWYQRYYMHGTLAPTWGLIQFDEIGAVVWALCRHALQTHDLAYGEQAFSQLASACTYMAEHLDAETGLAPVTWDLWEEREGISTYACACTWAAFQAFADLAEALSLPAEAERWYGTAARVKQAIETHLWDAAEQRFLRGIRTHLSLADADQLLSQELISEQDLIYIERAGQKRPVLLRDKVIDSSILGLSIPFGVFAASDPRMQTTAAAIEQHLTSPVGGIVRYARDHYRGGNPWIICTLWLALHYLASSQHEQGSRLYTWALQHCTSLDLFSEQIDQETGRPCWVNPLAWSHAMFLLCTQACLREQIQI